MEDEHAIDPELTAADDAEALRRQSVGAQSALSGTTAKTSFSQTEVEELDKDLMLETLPRLDADAEAILQLLLPNDPGRRAVVWKEVGIDGSRDNKLFRRRLTNLSVDKADFGSKTYIDQNIVLRVLLDSLTADEIPNGLWRPDPLLAKANLAQALCTLVQAGSDPIADYAKCYEGLLGLESAFAAAMGTPVFTTDAFKTYLAIATQLAIVRLVLFRNRDNFSPRHYIMTTFWSENEDGETVFPQAEALRMHRVSDAVMQLCMNQINERTESLVAPFVDTELDDEQYKSAINNIRANYPWTAFLEDFRRYSDSRKAQLDHRILQSSGTERLVANLRAEIEQNEEGRRAEARRQSFKQAGGTPMKAFGKAAMAQMKARQQQLTQQNVAPVAQMGQTQDGYPQTAPPMGNNMADVDWVPEVDDKEGALDRAAAAQGTAQSTLAHLSNKGPSDLQMLSDFQTEQARNAGQGSSGRKGKKRSFLDPQEGAQREHWQSQGASQFSMPTYNPEDTLASQLAKHARDETNEQDAFDPTQDEGFQNDMRDQTGAALRRALAPGGGPGRAPVASMGGTPGMDESDLMPSPAKRQRKNPGSTVPAMIPFDPEDPMADPNPASSLYERAKVQAKQKRAIAQSQKPPQVRRPWSEEEEAALIELIETLGGEGISWSSLKTADNSRHEDERRLPARSSEDMRFKARNMKLTFLL